MDEFEVLQCSPEALEDILSSKSKIPSSELSKKLHVRYFEDYFLEIGAETIVVENNYVDHDYSEDHAEYYVRCFKDYSRKCTRLHIFKNKFSKEELTEFLTGTTNDLTGDSLQANYLGFIVVKPLPKTIIGRTCLETYPLQGTRFFPITRSYSANLFGIQLSVRNSLAFQEQDTVVAACATSALWSIFQGTGKLFQHAIPSPSAITKAATEYITDGDRPRAFPSKGLDVIEMARAIKNVDLEPNTVNVTNEYVLKSTAYAYLRMGIPMILGFPLYDTSLEPNINMGKHAVALAGFNLPIVEPVAYGRNNFRLKANRVNKLYVHDDQVGPFARMIFDEEPVVLHDEDDNPINLQSLSTSWIGSSGEVGSARAMPELLLIPLYHKIRIPFGCIHDQIMEFDALIGLIFSFTTQDFNESEKYEWDIYLTTVNDIKSELINDNNIDSTTRQNILISGMPKYIWRATVNYEDTKVLDVFFDATDLEQSSFVVNVIGYNSNFSDNLRNTTMQKFIDDTFSNSKSWPIIEWIREFF